jgi:leucyl aminopeptidase
LADEKVKRSRGAALEAAAAIPGLRAGHIPETILHPLLTTAARGALPIHFATEASWPGIEKTLDPPARRYAEAAEFKGKAGKHVVLPAEDGAVAGLLFGLGKPDAPGADPLIAGKLAEVLPAGTWTCATPPPDPSLALLAILNGAYRFDRYRKGDAAKFRIVAPKGVDVGSLTAAAEAVALGRDLVNTPAADLLPDALAKEARALAARHAADFRVTIGDELLSRNFPMIHAVGRASSVAPRLVDIRWGRPKHPAVTLVGKGVSFDTGGLDLKSASGMLLMKKDMGGAAAALAAAHMIMSAGLKVRLRVLLPLVENAVAGNAFRPGDILKSRKGLTVEIGNTDAEGRLILADALALADEDEPALLVDFATLTGAARVAVGPDLPPFYTDDDALAADIARIGAAVADPVWRLPLWRPYRKMLDSKIADINNAGSGGMAGSVTAALFLAEFVEKAKAWVHFDVYGWNQASRPGRPEGGEVQAARLIHALVAERFG